jgi:tRNA A-37 threonylcarbamoyl transferase component Bud32/tetratricopeptide (TPR) repeat protein
MMPGRPPAEHPYFTIDRRLIRMASPVPTIESLSSEQRSRVEETSSKFRNAITRNPNVRIQEFIADSSGIERQVLLRELLQIEIEDRRQRGQIPGQDHYSSLFPDSSHIVANVFDSVDQSVISSAAVETVIPGQAITEDGANKSPETLDDGLNSDSDVKTSESTIESNDRVSGGPEHPAETIVAGSDAAAETEQDTLVEPGTAQPSSTQSTENQTDVETIVPTDGGGSSVTMDENRIIETVVSGVDAEFTSQQPARGPVIGSGQTFGDYELISPLGQGGMGVVYKARQKAANRLVALKIIRPDRMSNMTEVTQGRMVDRFKAEAHAAARLQHDNLVTVYDVGEVDGCHYFSMQYVEGGSLTDQISDRSLDNREAATFIEPVCRAVHAAHEEGILHRDIKPANILIEDGTLRPRIADFGLAKLQNEDQELTRSGEAMGTPSYMPPEQFGDAASATARSDIYSIGATLYHLLSGRPPFKAATSMATMRQVLNVEPVALRELNPEVNQDLETICMKCLEKEPDRRFQTAAEVANELKRFINGEPILSRPLSRPERFVRWCRRNPLVSSLSGLAAASVLVALVSLAVAYVKTDEARQQVETSLIKTAKAQKVSEASFQDALAAVNDFFTHVSEDRLLNEPGAEGLRHELLELARDYYQRFLNRRSDDPTVREEVALSHFRVGLIVEELDSPQAAVESYEKARDLQRALLADFPIAEAVAAKATKRALSRTLNAMARVATNSGDLDGAEELFNETRKLRLELVESTPDAEERIEFDRLLASVDMNLGLLARRRSELDRTGRLYRKAQELRQKALRIRPKDPQLRRDLAKGWYNLANLAVDRNDAEEVSRNVDLAIAQLEELLNENPDDLRDRYLLALCYRMKADLNAAFISVDNSKLAEAIDGYNKTRFAMQDLSERSPTVHRYRVELGQLLLNIGQLEGQQRRFSEARSALENAEEVFANLVEEDPDNDEFQELLKQTQAILLQLTAYEEASA